MSVYEDFKMKLDRILQAAIVEQGELEYRTFNDTCDRSMVIEAGIDRLNAMSNVEFIQTLAEVEL